MKNLLEYNSVEISFNGSAVTHGVSFALQEGEILGIVGESGSGKSSLLKATLGLLGNDGLVTREIYSLTVKILLIYPSVKCGIFAV